MSGTPPTTNSVFALCARWVLVVEAMIAELALIDAADRTQSGVDGSDQAEAYSHEAILYEELDNLHSSLLIIQQETHGYREFAQRWQEAHPDIPICEEGLTSEDALAHWESFVNARRRAGLDSLHLLPSVYPPSQASSASHAVASPPSQSI